MTELDGTSRCWLLRQAGCFDEEFARVRRRSRRERRRRHPTEWRGRWLLTTSCTVSGGRRALNSDHGHTVGHATRTAIISDRRITGLSVAVIAELVVAVGPLRHGRRRAGRASRLRKRTVGTGTKLRTIFVDRLLATLVHLRHGLLVTCRPADSAWTVRPTHGWSARCGPY